MLGKRAEGIVRDGHGGNKKHARVEFDKHGMSIKRPAQAPAKQAAQAPAAAIVGHGGMLGGKGVPAESRRVGKGRSKWERFDRVDGTDSSEEQGIEGKGKVKGMVKHIEQVDVLQRHVLESSSSVATFDTPLTTMMTTMMKTTTSTTEPVNMQPLIAFCFVCLDDVPIPEFDIFLIDDIHDP